MRELRYILVLLAGTFLLSCTGEDMEVNRENRYEPGVETSISLKLGIPGMDLVQTKAGESYEDYLEYVSNLLVVVFNADGSFHLEHEQMYNHNQGTDKVDIASIESGKKYIYAVANTNSSLFNDNNTDLTEILKAQARKGRESFLKATVDMCQEFEGITEGRFLMSGKYVAASNDAGDGSVNIPRTGGTLQGVIELVRVQATVVFSIKGGEGVDFTPTHFQVCNLPKSSNLFEQASDVANGTYFNTEMLTYDSFKDSIFFYPMENRKQPSANVAAYRDRMDMANASSAYVVIKGTYSGKADHYKDFDKDNYTGKENAEAQVTYYIPLGYVNGNLNDYNVRRNTKYIYSITVNGVDDIVLEVVSDEEKSSVEDGDVIYLNGGKVIDLDAHYASGILTFNKADLESKSEITYKVKSPYTNGYQTGVDSDWVKFVINGKRQGVYSQQTVAYPGDNSSSLLSVGELMENLQNAETLDLFDNNDQIVVSCYVNEYYYEDKATEWHKWVNTDNREMLILCDTKAGNGSSLTEGTYIIRQKSIQTIFKTDGSLASAWGTEWFNETDNIQPNYGINSDNTDRSNSTANFASFNNDGRRNMIAEVYNNGNQRADWSDITTWNWDWDPQTTAGEYRKAYLACMSRNRDADGDGEFDVNEMKWYLASVNQYQDLWIGNAGINQNAHLYTYPTTPVVTHYFSNSKGQIFWAEEGAAVSPYHEHGGRFSNNRKHAVRCLRNLNVESPADQSKYIASQNDVLQVDYATVKQEGGKYVVELSGLNSNALRSYRTEMLTRHTEREEQNKPYASFTINDELTRPSDLRNGQYTWTNIINSGKDGDYGCPDGYRIPSQKELILMLSKVNDTDYHNDEVLSMTRSSFAPNQTGYPYHPLGYTVGGYAIHNYNPFMCVLVTDINNINNNTVNHSNYYLRCVKDN
ncbi:MAG: DUF4906 domain-containing protein [Bacteroidales bacterium]|nr:DUF4906 domain-containing protein [Bacteroidales bacterium]